MRKLKSREIKELALFTQLKCGRGGIWSFNVNQWWHCDLEFLLQWFAQNTCWTIFVGWQIMGNIFLPKKNLRSCLESLYVFDLAPNTIGFFYSSTGFSRDKPFPFVCQYLLRLSKKYFLILIWRYWYQLREQIQTTHISKLKERPISPKQLWNFPVIWGLLVSQSPGLSHASYERGL